MKSKCAPKKWLVMQDMVKPWKKVEKLIRQMNNKEYYQYLKCLRIQIGNNSHDPEYVRKIQIFRDKIQAYRENREPIYNEVLQPTVPVQSITPITTPITTPIATPTSAQMNDNNQNGQFFNVFQPRSCNFTTNSPSKN